MAISDRIAKARKAAGLTQSELARRLGIRPQSVQSWEAGITAPRARRLTQVAEVLGVPEAFFFEEADTENPQARSIEGEMAARIARRLQGYAEAGNLDRAALEAVGQLIDVLARRWKGN